MLDVYTVSFFGHRQVNQPMEVESRLEDIVRGLIATKEYVEFLVGRNGDFDQLVSSTVLRIKHAVRDDNNALVLVLPYVTAEYMNNQASFDSYYDNVEVSEAATGGHFKSAIQTRNREMVDRSDLVICCVEQEQGGAYQTMKYAEKQGKDIINVAGGRCGQ